MLAALLAVTLPASPADAQQGQLTPADLGVRTVVSFGRGQSTTGWNLLEVSATPRVPINGRIDVRSSGTLGVARVDAPFEVAAGATRVTYLLAPPTDQLRAELVLDDGARVRLIDPVGAALGGAVIVGGLGVEPRLPTPLSTAGSDRAVQGAAVDPAILDLGPRALDGLHALVTSAAELAALDATQRATITTAVRDGLALLVTVVDGDDPLALPWSPLATRVVGDLGAAAAEGAFTVAGGDVGLGGDAAVAVHLPAGAGSVTALATSALLDADAARPLWRTLVQLRPEQGDALTSVRFEGQDLSWRLFGGQGDLPGAWTFLAFALVFVLVVGPLNGLVLRRIGRTELAWVTVPAITVVFTAIAALAASAQATTVTPVVRAAWWLDGVGEEITVTSVQSSGRGTLDVQLPGRRDALGGTPWSGLSSMVLHDGDAATTVRLSLEPLQVASIIAWGTPEAPPPLEVDAVVRDGRLEVTVENTTDATLEEVTVRFATSRVTLGTLAAGANATTTLDTLDEGLPRAPARDGNWRVRQVGGAMGGELPGPDAAGELLAWSQLSGAPGIVWATAATTDDLGLAAPRVPGRVDDRGAFVAVGVTPRHASGPVVAHEVRRDVLDTWTWQPWRPGPLEVELQGELFLRFRLPAPVGDGTLVSTLDAGGGPADFGGMWPIECALVEVMPRDGGEPWVEERCGDEACGFHPEMIDCTSDGITTEVCFTDDTCETTTIIEHRAAERPADAPGGLFEVFRHTDGSWLPHADVFDDEGLARMEGLVSPIGEVLVRIRAHGQIDLARRGLEVRS